jgi:Galactose oxidase, central domain
MLRRMRRFPRRIPALATWILLAACAGPPAASPSTSEPPTPEASASASVPAPSATTSGSPEASDAPEPVTWSQLGATGPAPREDHTWTVDRDAGIAYLFGGRDGPTTFDDTWAYDLASDAWTQLAPAASPDGRFGHEAAWVDGVGVVIFAGQAGSTFFGDLWAYDPNANAWEELPATGAPPTPRYGSCSGIGPDGRLWISHGFTSDGTRFSDTRAYDFDTGAWTDETPDGARPIERCLHGCWWTDAGELALYAGQTTGTLALDDRWRLADGAWERVEGSLPAGRNLYARARIGAATLIFGGQALDESFLGDLWSFADDSDGATQVEVAGDRPQPAGRAGAELIVDEARGRALLFGGRTADGALADLWVLGGL